MVQFSASPRCFVNLKTQIEVKESPVSMNAKRESKHGPTSLVRAPVPWLPAVGDLKGGAKVLAAGGIQYFHTRNWRFESIEPPC